MDEAGSPDFKYEVLSRGKFTKSQNSGLRNMSDAARNGKRIM